jgi:hypothetical protein
MSLGNGSNGAAVKSADEYAPVLVNSYWSPILVYTDVQRALITTACC